jgi:hypothetical protein
MTVATYKPRLRHCRHTLEEISVATRLSIESVGDIVATLAEMGLFQTRSATRTIPVDLFQKMVEESSVMWRRQIGLHPLFTGLANGTFRTEVFIGLLLESCHYVCLLPRMLRQVAEGMRTEKYRRIVMNYAEEEMDHHLNYRQSLLQISRIAPHLEDAHPTVGTLSLIRNLESIGRQHELSLLACLQLIEAHPFEMADGEAHLLEIAGRYGMTHLMAPFIDHMRADIDLGHSSILMQALSGVDAIPAETAHQAVNDMHDLKHCFDVFHDSIIGYYGDLSNYIPRPRVDFFAL